MIGSNIRRLRLEKNMTQEELGKTANVGRATINRYESGAITNIPYDRIVRIASALEVTPGTLMGWEENETQPDFLPSSELTARIVPRIIEDELFSKAVEVLEAMDQKELTAFIALFGKK